jgi:hypothetical protein
VRPDPEKLQIIKDWPVPKDVKQLQSFLGLANYFNKHVRNYSAIAAPLTNLTQAKVAQGYDWNNWGAAELKAFEALKHALTTEPVVLHLPDLSAQFTLHTDASEHGCGGTLLQDGKVVAYCSHKFTPAERKYAVYEQEAMALYLALKKWRCYLEGAPHAVCLTDHKPLQYLLSQTNLNRRQTAWLEYMSRFPIRIQYIRGVDNVVADAISRCPGYVAAMHTRRMSRLPHGHAPGGEDAAATQTPRQKRPKQGNQQTLMDTNGTSSGHIEMSSDTLDTGSLFQALRDAYVADTKYQDPEYVKDTRWMAMVYIGGEER